MSHRDDAHREEFIRRVLQRTSGSACARAHELLCSHVDGELEAVGEDLIRGHLAHCASCAALATTLAVLDATLPALARTHPGQEFTRRVLAATLPWSSRQARRWRRFGGEWMQLLRRPRFAWEAAYVGAMFLGLIFGTPASPLRDVPGRALTLAQTNPVQALERTPLAQVPDQLRHWSRSAWQAGGAPLLARAGEVGGGLASRLRRAAGAARPMAGHGRELGAACVRLDPGEGAAALGRLGSDMKMIWLEFSAAEEPSLRDAPTDAGESHE